MDYDDDDLVEEYHRAVAHRRRVEDFHAWTMIVLLLALGIVPLLPFIAVAVFLLFPLLLP